MKRLFILIPIFALLLNACNVLDTTPKSQVTADSYFTSETDLQLFSNSFYSSLLSCSFNSQSDVLIHSVFSDEIYGGSYRNVPESGGNWTWTVLRKINTLLEYVDNCDDEAAVIKYTAITRFFRAYFYFDKIWRFGDVPWCESQLDSDSDELYKPRDTREYVMTKMLEDIDYAIENLDDDENCFRVDKWAALAFKSRFCLFEGTFRKYHGISYDEHTYNYYLEQAADAAYQLMQEGPFKLYSTGDTSSDYMMLFAEEDADTGEYILARQYSYALNLVHNATGYTLLTANGMPGFTRKFVCTYLMADGTRFTDQVDWERQSFAEETANRDPRMAQTMRTPGYHRIGRSTLLAPDFTTSNTGYQPVKFVQNPDDANGQVDRVDYSTADLPIIRYAEVLLNYAEAKAELGTLTQNDVDVSINLLRDRVGMPHLSMVSANSNPDWYLASSEYGYPNVTGSNQGIILEIRRERTIELVMEGFRWRDLMRWKCGPCLNQELVGMYFPSEGEYDMTGDGSPDLVLYLQQNTFASGVTAYKINTDLYLTGDENGNVDYHKFVVRDGFNEERDYYYPIPTNDLTLNPNLTQNPGWE